MTQFLALVSTSAVCAAVVIVRWCAKQDTRLPPNKDGWREPAYLLNDHAGGATWASLAFRAYVGVLVTIALVVAL